MACAVERVENVFNIAVVVFDFFIFFVFRLAFFVFLRVRCFFAVPSFSSFLFLSVVKKYMGCYSYKRGVGVVVLR